MSDWPASRLLKRIISALRGHSRALQGVSPTAQFNSIIERERARADRSGQGFSVLAFDVGAPESSEVDLSALAQAVSRRSRLTDALGWLDERRLAILLWHTPAAGAWRFAERVRRDFAERGAFPPASVFAYPCDAGHSSNESNGKGSEAPAPEARPPCVACSFFTAAADEEGKPEVPKADVQESDALASPSFFREQKLPQWKRAMDIAGASAGLLVSAPLFLLIAAYIKIVSPGPIFFKQQRIGFMGRPFTMWKFRTMQVDADASHHKRHLADLIRRPSGRPMEKLDGGDPRIIPFGGFLRKSMLDELPQLLNVLRGEMSLVGPRPPIPYEVEEYLRWHNGRLDAVPGMTGLWQVSGKNRLSFEEMARLDIQYARTQSLARDTAILLRTPWTVVQESLRSARGSKELGKGRASGV